MSDFYLSAARAAIYADPPNWPAAIAVWYAAYLAQDADHKILARYIYDATGDKPLGPLRVCACKAEYPLLTYGVVNVLLSYWPAPDSYVAHVGGVGHALLRWVPELAAFLEYTRDGERQLNHFGVLDVRYAAANAPRSWVPALRTDPCFVPRTLEEIDVMREALRALEARGWKLSAAYWEAFEGAVSALQKPPPPSFLTDLPPRWVRDVLLQMMREESPMRRILPPRPVDE